MESLQRKEKQYREFMITLTGTSEKRYAHTAELLPERMPLLYRIVDLQAALFRMKQQYETAQKRIREETDLKNKFEQDLIREQQHIQELTLQNEQQQKILKLKTEGLVAAQRRLRGATANGHTLAEATSTFDLDMERLIAERKELDSLRQDVQKREELIQKRELFLHERTQLEAKKTRASQMLDKVSDIVVAIEGIVNYDLVAAVQPSASARRAAQAETRVCRARPASERRDDGGRRTTVDRNRRRNRSD